MLKSKEIAEISLALWYLPLDKVEQVRDLVLSLKEKHGYPEPTDDSDEWTEEDRQQFTEAAMKRTAEVLAEMRRTSKPLPPGSPSTVELLREDRGR